MSSKSKGNAHELEVKKHLEAEGWEVFRVHRKPLWMDGRMITIGADVFGCDLIAKKTNEMPLWIQVGADGSQSKKQKQLLEHVWNGKHERVQVWTRVHGRKEYRVFELAPTEDSGDGPWVRFVEKDRVSLRSPTPKA